MPLTGAVLAIVTAALVLPAPPAADAEPDRPAVLTHAGYDAYRWIAKLPLETRVLANAWTEGSFAALAERPGIVDGAAPYAADPAVLARATGLLLDARTLFAEPDGPVAATFLEREQVGYLLVVTPDGTRDDLGGHEPFTVDLATLQGSTRYRLEQTFGDGRLLLFRVLD
jgi:hypothetical protein